MLHFFTLIAYNRKFWLLKVIVTKKHFFCLINDQISFRFFYYMKMGWMKESFFFLLLLYFPFIIRNSIFYWISLLSKWKVSSRSLFCYVIDKSHLCGTVIFVLCKLIENWRNGQMWWWFESDIYHRETAISEIRTEMGLSQLVYLPRTFCLDNNRSLIILMWMDR